MDQDLREAIRKTIDADAAGMIDFTARMVAVDNQNPPGRNYQACIELISAELKKLDLEHQVIQVPAGENDPASKDFPRYCLLGGYGPGSETLYFHGHYDVVPAVSPDQFQPRQKGGRLFGRGTSDMKSGLAAMIYAVKALKETAPKLGGRVGLTIVPDEETGGLLGSQHLAREGLLGRDGLGMLTPEPTSGAIWNANRGAVTLLVRVKGVPAHVGLQHQGSNAFEKMIPLANDLLELKAEVEQRTTAYNLTPEEAKRSILMMGGLCQGGAGFNLVPEEFSFTVDRRINPEEDLQTEKKRLLDRLEAFARRGLNLEVEILQEGLSSGVPEDHPLAQALKRNVEEVTGLTPAFEMCPGLLEIRFYAQSGIPAFAFGPGLLEVSHGPQEFVEVAQIPDSAAVYALTALDLLGEKR